MMIDHLFITYHMLYILSKIPFNYPFKWQRPNLITIRERRPDAVSRAQRSLQIGLIDN